MQGPVNYFKEFGPDSKSKEKQLKTVKEGSGMIRNVYLDPQVLTQLHKWSVTS